jgi:hemerythrin-like metal-binding protein
MFEWKKEFSLGHADIDSQHQRLFELASKLHSAMALGQGRAATAKTLADLVSYTKQHFANEERLMQSHHYPLFVQHKVDHDTLTAQVVKFQKDFEAGRVGLTVGLLQFLKDWLQHHIAETDRKVATFLLAKAA